jgi:ornithine cyclodeaminase
MNGRIAVISETTARELVPLADAIAVTEAAFVALAQGYSHLFQVTRGHGSNVANNFGVKAGYDGVRHVPGLKVGTYWPGNRAIGLGNHGSTVLLLDDATGFVQAIVAATHLTALRTAAADAVAVKYLARKDAAVLALIGTGHQAYYDALAISQVRNIGRVLVCGRSLDGAQAMAQRLREAGLPAVSAMLNYALGHADIVSTVTASREPLFDAERIAPGTHISAMGADRPGKQELPVELVMRSKLWADAPQQAVEIGEFQHAFAAGRIAVEDVSSLGAFISGCGPSGTGRDPGETRGGHIAVAAPMRGDEITIFDSSGIALQDLAICALALERAQATGDATYIDLI